MKAVQISVDDNLLRQLDADEEARRDGRSAVIRRAVAEYLDRGRRRRIAERYRAAYGGGSVARDADLAGWEDEGVWPDA